MTPSSEQVSKLFGSNQQVEILLIYNDENFKARTAMRQSPQRRQTLDDLIDAIISEIPNVSRTANAVDMRSMFEESQRILRTELAVNNIPYFGFNHDVAFKTTRLSDKLNGSPMYMGLEIEGAVRHTEHRAVFAYLEEMASRPQARRLFGLKTDGSLPSGYNSELYTARATLHALRKNVNEIMAHMAGRMFINPTIELMSHGCSSPSSDLSAIRQYGMHCHVGWQCLGLSAGDSSSLNNNLVVQRVGYVAIALFRHLNTLCRKIGGRPKTRWCGGTKSTSLRSIGEIACTRGAVNPFTEHGTIEFRFGRGMYDYEHTMGFVELCHALFRFAHKIVSEDLDHLALAKPSSYDNLQLHGLSRNFYQSAPLMIWSKEHEKMQRKVINIMFHDFVMENKSHYEVLQNVVDHYYQNEGKHFMKKGMVVAPAQAEATDETTETC